MATTSTKLADELREIVGPAFKIRAILQGALALMNEAEGSFDRNGDLWSVRELIEEAWEKVGEIYGDRECALLDRLQKIDEVTA